MLRDRIISNLVAISNAVNFYVYLIFGNKFRADFKKLFGKKLPAGGGSHAQSTKRQNEGK